MDIAYIPIGISLVVGFWIGFGAAIVLILSGRSK